MADIIEFKKGEEPEQEHTCETCEVVEEFLQYILDTDDHDQLKEILADLFAEGKIVGYQQALHEDIQAKIGILNDINGICDCETCDENDCKLDK